MISSAVRLLVTGTMVWSLLGCIVLVLCVGTCENAASGQRPVSTTSVSTKCRITTNEAHELIASTANAGQCLCATDTASCKPVGNCATRQTLGMYESATPVTVCLVDPASSTSAYPAVTTPVTTPLSSTKKPKGKREHTTPAAVSSATSVNGLPDVSYGSVKDSTFTHTPAGRTQAQQAIHTTAPQRSTRPPAVAVPEDGTTTQIAAQVTSDSLTKQNISQSPGTTDLPIAFGGAYSATLASTTGVAAVMHGVGKAASSNAATPISTKPKRERAKRSPAQKMNNKKTTELSPSLSVSSNVPNPTSVNPTIVTTTTASSVQTTIQAVTAPVTESKNDAAPVLTHVATLSPTAPTPTIVPRADVRAAQSPAVSTQCWKLRVPGPPVIPAQKHIADNTITLNWNWPSQDTNLRMGVTWNGSQEVYINESSYEIQLDSPWNPCNVTLRLCIEREDDPCTSLICGVEVIIPLLTVPEAPGHLEGLKQSSATNSTAVLTWAFPKRHYPELRYQVELYWVSGNASTEQTSYEVGPFLPDRENDVQALFCITDDKYRPVCSPALNIRVRTLPGAPSAVKDLKVLKNGPNFLELEWSAPSQKNGPLDFYRVAWTGNDSIEIDGKGKLKANYNISKLQPWSNYSIQVAACNRQPGKEGGKGLCGEWKSMENIQTDADAPGLVPPLNVTATGSTSLYVAWEEPGEKNGPISSYRIKWVLLHSNNSREEKVDGDTLTYTVSGLKSWSNYTISVKACNVDLDGKELCGAYTSETESTAVGVPGSVSSLNAAATGSTTINVNWEEPERKNGPISSYRIKWESDKDVAHRDETVDGTNTTYDISNLKPWSNYTISVEACNVDLNGKELCGLYTSVTESTDAAAPEAVSSLTVSATGSTFMNVSWGVPQEKNGPISSYSLKWVRLSDKETREKSVNGNTLAYSITGLKAWSNYSVTVKACNKDSAGTELCGEYKSETASTAAAAPTAPRNLHPKEVRNTTVTIVWESPMHLNGRLDGYEVTWKTDGSSTTDLSQTTNVTSLTLAHLKPYTTYHIAVRAFNEQDGKRLVGESATLKEKTQIGIPGPPTNFSTEVAARRLSLSWTAPREPNGPLNGYNVTWAVKDKGSEGGSNVTTIAEVVIDGLKPYTAYEVKVQAFNEPPSGDAFVGEAAVLEYVTSPAAPSAPTSVVSRPGTRNISLEWKVPKQTNGPIDGYLVRFVDSDGTKEPQEENIQARETVLTGLAPYKGYNVTITAYNSFNATTRLDGDEISIQVSTRSEPPGPVEDPRVSAFKNNSVRLTWRPPSDVRGKLVSFLLTVNDTKGDNVAESYPRSLDQVCNKGFCEYLFTRLHAECKYLFDVQGINEGVKEAGESPLEELLVTVPAGDPPQAKNISTVRDGVPHHPHSQFLFSITKDTFNDFNGAIVRYEVIASESSCIDQTVADHLTWGEVMSKDLVRPYRASPVGWNPFTPGASRSDDPMACTVSNRTVVCILGAQPCHPDSPMPCNGPLKAGTSYAMYVRGHTTGGSRATAPLLFFTAEPETRGAGGAIAGGIVGALLIALLLVAAVYARRFRIVIGREKMQPNGSITREGKRESRIELIHLTNSNGVQKKGAEPTVSENEAMDKEDKEDNVPIVHEPKGPIPKTEFPAYVDDMMRDCGYQFMDEYERLVELSPHYRCDAAREPANVKKNRFTNIHPFDKNRVPLSEVNGDPHSSYINASFIQGFNSTREYVAAQGPNVTTINDFWRMIWEHDVKCIVMLTQCVEGNKKKCERYWPDEEQTYGAVQVKKDTITTHEDYTVTSFSLKSDDSKHPRSLHHVFFTGWPDHGVPETPHKLIDFVRVCQTYFGPRSGNQPPIVVHCSAGVGRTGTFIALDYLLQLLQVQETVNIFSLVLQLRESRRCMVQNESQYIYLHQCVKAVLQGEEKEASSNFIDEPLYENVEALREAQA